MGLKRAVQVLKVALELGELVVNAGTRRFLLRDGGRGRDDDRYHYEELRGIIAQVETGANRFHRSLDRALNESRLNGTQTEREVTDYVHAFEEATNRLKNRVQHNEPVGELVRDVLQRGDNIDRFMRRNRLGDRAERDWASLRNDLDRLAGATRTAWRWGNR